MKFDQAKKKAILEYILEKIGQGEESVSKVVSETFGINQNTVHTYITQLLQQDVIERVKKGQYKLKTKRDVFQLKRSAGDLDSDTYAFQICLKDKIQGFSDNVQGIWNYAFTEMINNVMDHSQAENVTIAVSQDQINTTVSILDDGIGIFRKIKDYFGFLTLEDAICELFKGKLTTDLENHSGEGIFFSSRMMDLFGIISDNKLFTHNKFDMESVRDWLADINGGTFVMMQLSNTSQKTAAEIFNMYSDMDHGFSKTVVPLKNMFDSAPVSRSQAKRVCNRLDKFEEVEIDFLDLEWMGQGFAHQLFVVFAKQHPEIRLTPVNMGDGVERMYRHVIARDK